MNRTTMTRLLRVAMAAIMMAVTLLLVPEAVQSVEASPKYNHLNIECNETVRGQITNSNYFDSWPFNGKVGDKVTITMIRTSGNLDSVVGLGTSDSGRWLKTGESAGGSRAVISNFTLPKTGTYTIYPTRYHTTSGTTSGYYMLTLTCSGVSSSGSSSNSCSERGGDTYWEGMIKDKFNINRIDTNLGDFWAFKANSGDRVELWLSSYDFDPAIGLYYWNGSKWITIGSGSNWDPPVPPDVSFASPTTTYIDKKINISGCYYVWALPSRDSYKKTGQYFLEIGFNNK